MKYPYFFIFLNKKAPFLKPITGVLLRSKILFFLLMVVTLGNFSFAQETANFSHLNKTFRYDSQIVFDSLGYVWISDSKGLYKYDGCDYFFTPYAKIVGRESLNPKNLIFKKDERENFWLSTFDGDITRIGADGNYVSFKNKLRSNSNNSRVSAIQPEENFILFGTATGTIFKYDYNTAKIDSISTLPFLKQKPQEIRSIAFTNTRTLWVSTFSGVVYQYIQDSFGSKWSRLNGPYYNPIGGLSKIISDKKGALWIISEYKGLFSYNPLKGIFKAYKIKSNFAKQASPLFISVFYDEAGYIWAGTDGNGLFKVDLLTDKIVNFTHQSENRFSLSNNTIAEINKDYYGNIWVSNKNGYIDILPYSANGVAYYCGSENGVPSPTLSILETKDKSVWIGTDGFGINRVLPNGESIQYNIEKEGAAFFEGKYIQAMAEDDLGNIWIATYQNGLFVFNSGTGKFNRIPIKDSFGNVSLDVRYVFKDSQARIWVATSIGFHLFSKEQEVLVVYELGENGLSGIIANAMIETEEDAIWLAVYGGGLFRYTENGGDLAEASFENIKFKGNNRASSAVSNIVALTVDQNKHLLFSTSSGELFRLNPKTLNYKVLSNEKALKGITANSLVVDNKNSLWIGSNFGLHEYDFKNKKVTSFNLTDGLQNNTYKKGSYFKSKENKIYFGGKNGVNSFFPENIIKRKNAPKLYVNAIEILHKPAKELLPLQIVETYEKVKSLELTYDQASFSFQFSAIENVLNSNYHYSYMLQGFDEEWIRAKEGLSATFTNVPSGNYIFKVRAGTKEDVWNIGTKQISIVILPPWWMSIWAYVVYFLFVLLIGYSIFRWITMRNRLRQEKWEHKKDREVYDLKMNFFAKMSHEIQTPLTLILGPIDDMLQRATLNKDILLKQRLAVIKNNAKRLSRISTDLTTIRNKELNQLKIQATKTNIVKDLKEIALSFEEQARFKNIDFIKEFPDKRIFIWYDKDKIEHVFYNLLSNAFKYTPVEGSIFFTLSESKNKKRLKIAVTDSGPGIPKSELKDIFKLFYRSATGKNIKGSGIGLALSKELIHMHHGKIKVTSSKTKGSSFYVYLPTEEKVFTDDQKIEVSVNEHQYLGEKLSYDIAPEKLAVNTINKKKRYQLLIVEDNVEMQIFLKDLLGNQYNIVIAENGAEGLKQVNILKPNVIISDIMMPIMDGLEMSKALKKDIRTAHIPILLLTAKNTTVTKLIGLSSGALHYLNKPFNPQELLLIIANILNNTEQIISEAKTNFISSATMEGEESKAHIFLKELVFQLNENMEESTFKLEHLAESMNMSYSVIYRNCQEITGKSLVEFARSLKLKRAAMLILEHGYNISETAFKVGYKDPKYFSKCFKDEFGTTPVAMKNEGRKTDKTKLTQKYKLQ